MLRPRRGVVVPVVVGLVQVRDRGVDIGKLAGIIKEGGGGVETGRRAATVGKILAKTIITYDVAIDEGQIILIRVATSEEKDYTTRRAQAPNAERCQAKEISQHCKKRPTC